jgi:hypothetical protein
MTSAEFRRIALSFRNAAEKLHMGHPDFRVGDRIFATLGYPDARHGTVLLSPQDQEGFVRDYPRAFKPAPGAWGKSGSTLVVLRFAPRTAVILALEAAWARRAGEAPPDGAPAVRARARQRR